MRSPRPHRALDVQFHGRKWPTNGQNGVGPRYSAESKRLVSSLGAAQALKRPIFGPKSPSEVDTHGRAPGSWVAMQGQHDLSCARKGVELDTVRPVRFDGPGDSGQPAA